jgi:alcohol dehydrogenase class IV
LNALLLIDKKPVDLILAIGGGSAIDLAKGISAFHNLTDKLPAFEELSNEIQQKAYLQQKNFIDILAIPTTDGTGSELTSWATIWDMDAKIKYSIDCGSLTPRKAFLIPALTLTLSKELTLSTGLDALCHAIEAYWSKHTGPLVQELAYRAVQIILEYLPNVIHHPDNLAYRSAMCRASVLAGMAFSKTRTTACHSISYPLTMFFGIPHGLAAAMTLGEISKANRGSFPNDAALYALFDEQGGIQSWLDQISEGIIPLKLSAFHIPESAIDLLVSKAFTGGRMDNNPAEITKDDVRRILANIYQ